MAEIVDFPSEPPKDRIWVCADCSCVTFKLREDGKVVCANCGHIGDGSYWFDVRLREPRKEIVPDGTTEVVDFDSNATTLRNTLKQIGDVDTLYALLYVKRDGFAGSWGPQGNRLTDDEQKWVAERFSVALNMLLMPEFAHGSSDT